MGRFEAIHPDTGSRVNVVPHEDYPLALEKGLVLPGLTPSEEELSAFTPTHIAEQNPIAKKTKAQEGAYVTDSGEIRYPSMGWAMQQDPELYDVLNQQKIDQYIRSGHQARNYADNWFAPGVSPQTGEPRGFDEPEEEFTGGGPAYDYQAAIDAAYEQYFGNQERYAQEKFDSISDYLDQLQISSDEGFAADMERIGGMYEDRREARNQRFAEALNRAGGRESAAIDTLAELGIEADANTFDPETGEANDMLFSQQMSGADMLNTMSYITETIYDFAKNEQDLAIGAGLENAQQNLLAEMAAIQMARDSRVISTAEAAAASAAAAAEAASLHEYYITMGGSIGMSPEVSIAYGELGMLGDAYGTAMEPIDQTYSFPGYEGVDMTIDQAISAGLFEPQEGGLALNVGGAPGILPWNTNWQDLSGFFDSYEIPVAPLAQPEEG